MNDMTPTREQRTAALEGMGCKRKRVEDIRFTQGKGNYVDDVKLPGMLHGDFVRSPHAHARVKSIDKEKALKVPGVLAVITAETLKTVNLAWMPTLAGDVQMVLADGKVLFQNQEVAFVVATDRYAADDGINKVIVEYEPLPPLIDPFKAMAPDAPVLREDLAGKTSGAKAGFDLTWPFGSGTRLETRVPAPPQYQGKRFASLEAALQDGPKSFAALMSALGSRDGREIVRLLETLRQKGTLARDAEGRYLIKSN